jgi:hypothetical protein
MLATIVILLQLAVIQLVAHAQQSYTPYITINPASVFIENQAMYVLGGQKLEFNTPFDQMFSIDLSTSWTTDAPLFKELNSNGIKVYGASNALLRDKKSWFIMEGNNTIIYDLSNSTSRLSGNTSQYLTYETGLGAALDPVTNTIYIPNGAIDSPNATTTQLLRYDMTSGIIHTEVMHPQLLNISNFGVAWASSINSMLLFGGGQPYSDYAFTTNNNFYYYRYPDGWQNAPSKGDVPSKRMRFCFVPAYSGTKMVLFGGSDGTGVTPSFGDIYILDVATFNWTKGETLGTGRFGSACAVSGDYFIIWGGDKGTNITNTNIASTFVYDLKSNQWVSTYSPYPSSFNLPSSAITSKASNIVRNICCALVFAVFLGVFV